MRFTEATALAAAAATFPEATIDIEALTMRVPGDGSIAALRRVLDGLDGLDDNSVAGLTVESAGLDDVFLALTGRAAEAPASEGIPA